MVPIVIDIYHGNVVNDFAALKAVGIIGIIHKCTQGAGYADPLYAIRRKQATDAGLLWGAYSFNTGEDIPSQVGQLISHADPEDQTLVALDFEDNPHSQMSLVQARQWLELMEEELGRKPVIYSGNRIKDLLGNTVDSFFGSHRLWLAQYGPVAHVQPSWATQWLWQYSEAGHLTGTDGMIDLNSFNGSAADLATEWAS
jgi:lysozyme